MHHSITLPFSPSLVVDSLLNCAVQQASQAHSKHQHTRQLKLSRPDFDAHAPSAAAAALTYTSPSSPSTSSTASASTLLRRPTINKISCLVFILFLHVFVLCPFLLCSVNFALSPHTLKPFPKHLSAMLHCSLFLATDLQANR